MRKGKLGEDGKSGASILKGICIKSQKNDIVMWYDQIVKEWLGNELKLELSMHVGVNLP